MFVEKIKIVNFRNIVNTEVYFNKKLNFLIGDNAQGKTNLIESIYVSAFLKSFRTQKNSDLIKNGESFSSIKLIVSDNNVKNSVKFSLVKDKKKIEVNDKKPESFKYLNIVIFYPDEVNYINSYPSSRRNLLDRSIFYTNYNYLNIYRKYTRCLKQRNIYLKNKSDEIDCWKEQLIFYGSEIIKERIKYINRINKIFTSSFFKKTNSESYSIKYPSKYFDKSIEDHLQQEFNRKESRERLLGYTLVGPHRDDIGFYLNDMPAESFASQGQRRSLVISYKTAQILDYKAVQGHYPVLILDDMTSELDANRKNVLLENLLENSGQVFITSTDFKQTDNFAAGKVFKVNNGSISEVD